MNRLEAVAGLGIVALIGGGLGHEYLKLSAEAQTPAPPKTFLTQSETRPDEGSPRTVDAAVTAYVKAVDTAAEGEKAAQLGALLTALEAPEFEGEPIGPVAAEGLARAIVAQFSTPGDGSAGDVELRRRAVGFLAWRVPGATSRDFVLKAMDEGPEPVRLAALEHVGSTGGVHGASVYAKVKELSDKGFVPDGMRPQTLRRAGGLKAREELLSLMSSTDNAKLIAGCAVSLQDYQDPELLGPVLERLEQVGMLDASGRLPWISPALLDKHLQSADKTHFRRGIAAMSARPILVKTGIGHVERALQSPDADTRRFAAIAVKKAVVAKIVDAKQGEALLAGRLEVETEPILKAELSGGLERVRSILAQPQTPSGVQ